ncbi:MAG: hypothetical protein OHK0041_03680 [Anaerolineales bacterium]
MSLAKLMAAETGASAVAVTGSCVEAQWAGRLCLKRLGGQWRLGLWEQVPRSGRRRGILPLESRRR